MKTYKLEFTGTKAELKKLWESTGKINASISVATDGEMPVEEYINEARSLPEWKKILKANGIKSLPSGIKVGGDDGHFSFGRKEALLELAKR